MTKTPNEVDRIAALENELRLAREESAAQIAAIYAELRQARGAGPQGPESLELARRFDPELRAKWMAEKTKAAIAAMDERQQAVWRAALQGQFLFVIMIENPRGHHSGAPISISQSRSSRIIGVDAPSAHFASLELPQKYAAFIGAIPPLTVPLYVKHLAGERGEEVRAMMLAAIENGTPNPDLITLCVTITAEEMEGEIAARQAAQIKQQPQRREVPNRYAIGEFQGVS